MNDPKQPDKRPDKQPENQPDKQPEDSAAASEGAAPRDVGDLSAHLKETLTSAERAAQAILNEARANGERLVGAAKQKAQEDIERRSNRMRALSDGLLRQANEVSSQLDALDDSLGRAIESLARELERLPGSAPASTPAPEQQSGTRGGLRERLRGN